MKLHQLIFVILLTGLLSCQNKKNEIIITGKINGEIPEKIDYTLPINGVCNYAFKDTVQPDSLGNFTIIVNIEEPTFIKIFIPEKANGTLLLEKGMNYDVNFDLKLKENNFKVNCYNQVGQETYNNLPNPIHIQIGAENFLIYSSASDIKAKIDSLRENEIALFNKLLSERSISSDFFQLVKLDRECYYAAIKGTVALMKKYEDVIENNGVFSPDIKRMWEESFMEISPTKSTATRSPWYYSLAENYVMYNEYTNDSFDLNNLKKIFDSGLIHTHNIEEAKKYLNSNVLEYYIATYLFNACIQKEYEKELISLFDKFKKDFPKSKYTKFIEPVVSPIVEFHKKKEKSFNENIKFIPEYETINSLYESLSSLKGKKVYVDVWATWCGPCKAEFEHNAQLKKLLASKNVEILYISIDQDKYDTQWKEMIKYYNLEGFHIRANAKLNADLRKIYNMNGSLSIPWYLLIDENGNIIKKHASRPSQLNELEKEIDEN